MFRFLTILSVLLISGLCLAQVNRTYDGVGNNPDSVLWGSAGCQFFNMASNGFGDSISSPGGIGRPNPRAISNALGSQSTFIANELGLSDFVWGWGQFIDHDINLNDDEFTEPLPIPIPACDPLFDPNCSGTVMIPMLRSRSLSGSGTTPGNPRRHVNDITSFIDASAVYGSDSLRAAWLRTYNSGKMKTSTGELLPWNTTDGEFTSPVDPTAPFMLVDGPVLPAKHFVGGDIRVNEQPGLASFHTLWLREHNRLCDSLLTVHPSWNDEQLFQRARKIVGALIQAVTYEEFLPTIGVSLPTYGGYDDLLDPTIMNSFSAAAYRFGHTMVNGRLMRYEEDGTAWSFGAVDLRDAFFAPSILKDEGGIEPFFRGLAAQEHQFVDPMIMDDIRNMLFGPPGAGGLDLLAINIQRARERGVPDHNRLRQDLGLAPHADLTDLTSDTDLRYKLSTVYNSVDSLDPWIGLMSEDHLPNKLFGEALHEILAQQFSYLRDGDRYYYENDPAFTAAEIAELKSTTLSAIILRNSSIITLQANVFIAEPRGNLSVELLPFSNVSNLQLKAYPNPVQRYFEILLEARSPSAATLDVFDVNGILVSAQDVRLASGENRIDFELQPELANGLYSIVLRSEEGVGQLKLIKQQ
jgi:hypothetical protein